MTSLEWRLEALELDRFHLEQHFMTVERELSKDLDDRRLIQYFWLERQALERMVNWRETIAKYPEVQAAYDALKEAEEELTNVVRALTSKNASDE